MEHLLSVFFAASGYLDARDSKEENLSRQKSMHAQPECIVCAFRQALNTARIVSDDPHVHTAVMARLARAMIKPDMNQTPAGLSQIVYRSVTEVTGVRDPYATIKLATNRAALRLLPEALGMVRRSSNPLKAACKLAVAGNIIDLGIGHGFDLEADLRSILKQEFKIDAFNSFRRELRPGRRALYIGDNSGEIVFDRALVEFMIAAGVITTYAVKSGPTINDATIEDARFCGLTALVPVITTGSDDIGIYWPRIGTEFKRAYRSADLIIAKGHGNFETCAGRPGNFYFLLKAKCDMVARELKVNLGDLVFAHRRSR